MPSLAHVQYLELFLVTFHRWLQSYGGLKGSTKILYLITSLLLGAQLVIFSFRRLRGKCTLLV